MGIFLGSPGNISFSHEIWSQQKSVKPISWDPQVDTEKGGKTVKLDLETSDPDDDEAHIQSAHGEVDGFFLMWDPVQPMGEHQEHTADFTPKDAALNNVRSCLFVADTLTSWKMTFVLL